MKRLLCILILLCLLTGCTAVQPVEAQLTFTDALGYSVQLSSWERVVSLYGSFAECWMLAGGKLVGTTEDAVTERGLMLGEDTAIVGSVKEPNLEAIIAAQPDFVILSADTANQVKFHDALTQAGIPHAYYRVDAFADYLAMLQQFCSMTDRPDLYQTNGLAVQERIDGVLEAVSGQASPSVLLLRAYSTGVKAKGADNLTGIMLRDLGALNIADVQDSLLENLSLESIIAADPDYIFVTTMGSDEAALQNLAETWQSNPAWAGLRAVKNDRFVVLPKHLFHYKPNADWGESYAYLAKILYPQLAGQIQ